MRIYSRDNLGCRKFLSVVYSILSDVNMYSIRFILAVFVLFMHSIQWNVVNIMNRDRNDSPLYIRQLVPHNNAFLQLNWNISF